MAREKHVIGLLGSQLDAGRTQDRWARWRPSVAMCQHEDLLINRLELLHEPRQLDLAALVADDIRSISPETDVCLHAITFRDAWDFEEVFAALHQFARQQVFDTDQVDYLVHITTGTHVQQICLFLLAESRHLPGPLLQTSPPARQQTSPGGYRIIDLDLSRYDALATRFAEERQEGLTFLKSGIETRNPDFNRLMERIERVAIASRAPILMTGPTGAGKTSLARRIFELKRRRAQLTGDFIELNCATLRGDQAMSALFGHVKGAFTGAAGPRAGLLKAADQGLLFLDEIGELGPDEQAMLLRAIEEKTFLPVGADQEVRSDFQLIAGTNCSLATAVRGGSFRGDLLARINLWTFELPGLAARREDIAPNLDHELARFSAASGHQVRFTREARDAFVAWATSPQATWLANFRDLNAAVIRMSTLAHGGRIGLTDVHEEIQRLQELWAVTSESVATPLLRRLLTAQQLEQLDLFDQLQLEAVLGQCQSCRSLSEAGRLLFAVSRQTRASLNDADRLRKFLTRFGLTWQQVQDIQGAGG